MWENNRLEGIWFCLEKPYIQTGSPSCGALALFFGTKERTRPERQMAQWHKAVC